MSRTYVPIELRRRVEAEARQRCGYCLSSQTIIGLRLHIEHILPLALGGETILDNLWLACPLCNSYKGIQTEAVDTETGNMAGLYNPRAQNWRENFAWSDDGAEIIGLTPTGRATVIALQLNNEYIVPARRVWVSAGWHPPAN